MDQDAPRPVYVTRPRLPPLAELIPLLEEIWERRVLSNAGPLHQRFERALADFLGVPHVSLVNNATVGLVLALRRLGLTGGEVITTPFTFVGSAHAIALAGLTPVFVDIEPTTFALDPARVEAAVTERTRAILPVHCFGYAADVAGLGRVAARHDLRMIYDAAHAFGIDDDAGSLLRHGDASVLSFHATKVFTTFEGGAVVSPNEEAKEAIDRLRNFGFEGETTVEHIGTNAKMNEFSAALGLLGLEHVGASIRERGARDRLYRERLASVRGIRCANWPSGQTRNYYNFPILVDDDYPLTRDGLDKKLRERGIVARRYFYPLVSEFGVYRNMPGARESLPVARDVASRILCLPLYPDLDADEQLRVIECIAES